MVRLGKGSVSQVIEWLKCWGKDPAQRIEAFKLWARDVQWRIQDWEIKELEKSATEERLFQRGVLPAPQQLDDDSVAELIEWLKCWGEDPAQRIEAFRILADAVGWKIRGWEIEELEKSPVKEDDGEVVVPMDAAEKKGGRGAGKGGDDRKRSSVQSD